MTCRAAWWTDIHFELLADEQQKGVLRAWEGLQADCAIVTGDISHGRTTLEKLHAIQSRFAHPVYFVLGNHDFYGTSIARQRAEASRLADASPHLIYLTAGGIEELSATTAMVGHDGWGDAREGDFEHTPIRPPDLGEIEDFRDLREDRVRLRRRLERLGDEAAEHFSRVLPEALEQYQRVVVATHVPPFRQASWYEGRPSGDSWLPYFCCQAAGKVLLEVAERNPGREILVLCGHCHGTGEVRMRENLLVMTSGGEPCTPQVRKIFKFT